jgi:hypothetical protein
MPVQVYAREVNIDGVPTWWILQGYDRRKNLDNLRNDLLSMICTICTVHWKCETSLDVMETILPEDADPSMKPAHRHPLHGRIQAYQFVARLRQLEVDKPNGTWSMLRPLYSSEKQSRPPLLPTQEPGCDRAVGELPDVLVVWI